MLRNTVALKHHRHRIKLVLCEAELGKHLAGSLHVQVGHDLRDVMNCDRSSGCEANTFRSGMG